MFKQMIIPQTNTLLKLALTVLACLGLFAITQAAEEKYVQGLHGSAIQNASLHVEDAWYPTLSLNNGTSNDFTVTDSKVQVRLWFDESDAVYHGSYWQIQVTFDLLAFKADGTSQAFPGHLLTIDYDPAAGTDYTDISLLEYATEDFHRAELTNIQVTLTGLTNVPDDVHLDATIITNRFYTQDVNEHPYVTAMDYLPTTNELSLAWSYVQGAESYDLEWVFIDIADDINQPFTGAYAFDWKDATRVSLADTRYRLSLAFPRGIFVFRTRAVGVKGQQFDERNEGAWSIPNSINNLSQLGLSGGSGTGFPPMAQRYDFDGHDLTRNWQSTVGYREEGKNKEAISYFDGSMRNRQTTTVVSSDDDALSAQVVYDFLGRAAVAVAPAPMPNQGLRFYDNLSLSNRSGSGANGKDYFSYEDFDTDQAIADPAGLNNVDSKGGGAYYTPNNQNPLGPHGGYVPSADGPSALNRDDENFAFTRTLFANDGTGRVREQGGMGFEHRIGSDHTTKSFYGTPGSQQELDRLFGNEAGLVKHYKKNMMQDPNGQVTVTYVDEHGRIIATALAGDAPANLLEIDSKPDEAEFPDITSDLTTNNLLNQDGSAFNLSKTFFAVFPNQVNHFTYGLTGEVFTDECDNDHTCVYDLVIEVLDEDGLAIELQNDGTPASIWASIPTQGGVVKTIRLENLPLVNLGDLKFKTAGMAVGSYTVHKVLTLNQDALEAYRDFYEAQYETCYPQPLLTNIPCPTCDDLCAEQYTTITEAGHTLYLDVDGNVIAETDDQGAILSGTQLLIDGVDALILDCQNISCDEAPVFPNPCDLRLGALELDMSPGGQYFDNGPDQYLANYIPNPLYDDNGWLDAQLVGSQSLLGWFNTAWANAGGTGGPFADWDAVRSNWQDAMAEVLVAQHPEYCLFTQYCSGCTDDDGNVWTSEDFDAYFNETLSSDPDYFVSGVTINVTETLWNPLNLDVQNDPNNITDGYQPFNHDANVIVYDPAFACDKVMLTSMENYLLDFIERTPGNSANGYYSLWHLIEDPTGIAGANGANGTVPAEIRATFNALHGDGQGNPGLIGTGANQISAYTYFRSVYHFFRDMLLYDKAVTSCSALGLPLTDSDNDNLEDGTGFQINYPANALYDTYLAGGDFNLLAQGMENDIQSNVPASEAYDADGCACNKFNLLLQGFYDNEGISGITDITTLTGSQQSDLLAYVEELLSDDLNETIVWSDLVAWQDDCADDELLNMSVANVPAPVSAIACGVNELEGTEDTPPCDQQLSEIEHQIALSQWTTLMNLRVFTFGNNYTSACFNNIADRETFDMTYKLREYHYTLFWHDQSGNLVKAVPPAGNYRKGGTGQTTHNSILEGTALQDVADHRADPANEPFVHTAHQKATNYRYNSLGQMVFSQTPDGGVSRKWYDADGRVVASQDARQSVLGEYNYTLYDEQGRSVEAGVVSNVLVALDINSSFMDYAYFETTWIPGAGTRTQVTRTTWDDPLSNFIETQFGANGQENLRNRVASITYAESWNGNPSFYDYASHFTYDIHGNAVIVLQENGELEAIGQRFKRIEYDYDLWSGVANQVSYQAGQYDEFYHRYCYDDDNRLTEAYTSKDGRVWERENKYFYYSNGPLARTELGDKQIQGSDYAYSIHGWLKTVNSSVGRSDLDLAEDGDGTNLNQVFSRDAYAFSLHYYRGDYAAINGASPVATIGNSNFDLASPDLFNGNISKITVALSDENEQALHVHGKGYRYDRLNRLKQMRVFKDNANGPDGVRGGNTFASATDNGDYATAYSFDGSGNLLTLTRNAYAAGGQLALDDFQYHYDADGNSLQQNRLDHVIEAVPTSPYAGDIEAGQLTDNYTYDELGQLIHDEQEEIETIDWFSYHKVKAIIRKSGSTKADLEFRYGPAGHRCVKIVKPRTGGVPSDESEWKSTYYVRDLAGSILGTYTRSYTDQGLQNYLEKLALEEHEIYGRSRVGLINYDDLENERSFTAALNPDGTFAQRTYGVAPDLTADYIPNFLNHAGATGHSRELGDKTYELDNHLGNVMEVVSDRRVAEPMSSSVAYYTADVQSYSDYYPFGMTLPGRVGGASDYRFAFNGMEKDDEWQEPGNSYTTELRQYDARLGRWKSPDPVTRIGESPYVAFRNNPISLVDPRGDCPNCDNEAMANDGTYITWTDTETGQIMQIHTYWEKGTTAIASEEERAILVRQQLATGNVYYDADGSMGKTTVYYLKRKISITHIVYDKHQLPTHVTSQETTIDLGWVRQVIGDKQMVGTGRMMPGRGGAVAIPDKDEPNARSFSTTAVTFLGDTYLPRRPVGDVYTYTKPRDWSRPKGAKGADDESWRDVTYGNAAVNEAIYFRQKTKTSAGAALTGSDVRPILESYKDDIIKELSVSSINDRVSDGGYLISFLPFAVGGQVIPLAIDVLDFIMFFLPEPPKRISPKLTDKAVKDIVKLGNRSPEGTRRFSLSQRFKHLY